MKTFYFDKNMSLKNIVEKYLINTYSLDYNDDNYYHPIRIVQAAKSLIGINLTTPNKKLLDWVPNYLDQFENRDLLIKDDQKIEFYASMINLEILLKEKKFNQSRNEILRLLKVSTGEPILELLIFNSFSNLITLPFIFSIYRSVKFCNGQNIKYAILLAIDILEKNKGININLSKLQKLEIICYLIEISETQFIRNDEIQFELKKIDYSILKNDFEMKKKSKLYLLFLKYGREYLLKLIDLNTNILKEPRNLLIMDSIRILLRYRKSKENDNLLYYASTLIEEKIE